jgi:hypothetical protein
MSNTHNMGYDLLAPGHAPSPSTRTVIKSGAEMVCLYNISQPTVSRNVAQYRTGSA